ESGAADIVVVPKFDMHRHEFKITEKDVKHLDRKYNIPLDLHPCTPMEGWIMEELPEDHIGLGIVPIVDLFCVFYKISKQGHWFSFEKQMGKYAGGKIFNETFSEMKRWKDHFLFVDRRAISDAMEWRHHDSDVYDAFPDNDFNFSLFLLLTSYLFAVLLVLVVICLNTFAFLSFWVLLLREELQFLPSIWAKKKRVPGGSKDATANSGHVSSPTPLQTVALVSQVAQRQHKDEETCAPNDEGHLASLSPRGYTNEYVHHFTNVEENQGEEIPPRMKPLVNLFGQPTHPVNEPVFDTGVNVSGSFHLPNTLSTSALEWNIPQRCRMDTPEWCWELMTHLAPLAAQDESNALTNEAGWGKGLSEGRTDEEIMVDLSRVEYFGAYSNKKMYPIYDKLFEKQYPYVQKIAIGYRHSVANLLKVYPDPTPSQGTSHPNTSKAFGRSSDPPLLKKT
nr:hypothetical protein [Tanacetum cinerariifolium]